MAKYITISILVFLTISCDNNREINGFYFGKNGNIPVLVNYTQDYYINYKKDFAKWTNQETPKFMLEA